MSLHDEYARVTPFELAFPDAEQLAALAEAVGKRGADVPPELFSSLPEVAAFLSEVVGSDGESEELHHLGMLTYQAVHFWEAGCPLYLLDEAAARELVASSSIVAASDERPEPPTHAGYLQLPQHLFWATGLEGGRPESLDGIFWTATASDDLHVLTVSGLRPDRPGFAALALPRVPLADAALWVNARVRESGDDYASDMPGAELDRLHTIETAGEVLKLLARLFAYAAAMPSALRHTTPAEHVADASPRPSELPYTLVRSAA